MKRFKFRFEKVQAYRRHQEQEKQRELAMARQRELAQISKVEAIIGDRQQNQKREQECLTGRIEPTLLTGYTRYFLKLKQMELAGREILTQMTREVDKRRLDLIAAARQRKIYDKLEERHKERFVHEYNLILQKETDDIGQKIFWKSR